MVEKHYLLSYFVADNSDYSTTTTDEENGEEQCSCINECEVATYSSTVSTARLANTDILTDSGNGLESRVSQSFLNALDIAERVDEGKVSQTSQLLQNVREAHNRLGDMIEFYLMRASTSASKELELFSKGISRMLDSFIETSRLLHTEMNEIYSQYVDYFVTDLTTTLQIADRLYAQVTNSFMISHAFNDSEKISNEITPLINQLQYVIDRLGYFETYLDVATFYAGHLFPKQLLASPACQIDIKGLNSSVVEQIAWIYQFLNTSKPVTEKDLRNASKMRSLLSDTSNCLSTYKNKLESFRKELDLVQPPKFSSAMLSLSQMDRFNAAGYEFDAVIQQFVRGTITKKRMAVLYLTTVDKTMEANANQLINTNQSVFTKINANIDILEELLKTFFKRLFASYVSFQKYMKSTDKRIENYARKQAIWRKPVVNFQSSEVSTVY